MIGGNVGGHESLAKKDEKGSRDHPVAEGSAMAGSNLGSECQSVGTSIK